MRREEIERDEEGRCGKGDRPMMPATASSAALSLTSFVLALPPGDTCLLFNNSRVRSVKPCLLAQLLPAHTHTHTHTCAHK